MKNHETSPSRIHMLAYHSALKMKRQPLKYGTLGLSLVVAGFLTVAVATRATGPDKIIPAGPELPDSAYTYTAEERADAATDSMVATTTAEDNPAPDQIASHHSRYGEFLDWADRPPVNEKKSYYVRLDKQGIPISHFQQPDGSWVWAYSDGAIASHGLWAWSKWKRTGDRQYRATAIKVGQWLRKHQGKDGALRYNFTYKWGSGDRWAPRGTVSSVSQGLTIELFNRLGRATGDKTYFDRARLALRPYRKSIVKGDGTLNWYQGKPFFDHYPQPDAYILNSHLLNLVAFQDLSPRSKRARELYWKGRDTIRGMFPLYDLGPGSAAYDLTHRYSRKGQAPATSGHYTSVVIAALRELDRAHPDSVFRYYRDHWYVPIDAP